MAENASPPAVEGACQCGRYRFQASTEPFWISYCHCADCRKATGAAVTVFVGFREREIQLLGHHPEAYRSSPTVQRLFCAGCGTPIGYKDDRLPGEIYYYVGLLHDPSRFTPDRHAWVSERLAWLDTTDDLPRYEGFSRPRDEQQAK